MCGTDRMTAWPMGLSHGEQHRTIPTDFGIAVVVGSLCSATITGFTNVGFRKYYERLG